MVFLILIGFRPASIYLEAETPDCVPGEIGGMESVCVEIAEVQNVCMRCGVDGGYCLAVCAVSL